MTVIEGLAALEGKPEFAALSFDDQLRARSGVVAGLLSRSDNFSNLPSAAQAKLVENLVFRPPVFETQGVGHAMGAGLPIDQQTRQILEWYRNAENPRLQQRARRHMRSVVTANSYRQNSLIEQAGEFITDPSMKVLGGDGADDANWQGPTYRRDRQKQAQFFRYLSEEDARLGGLLSQGEGLGALVGAGLDFAALYPTMVGSVTKPAGLVRAATRGLDRVGARVMGASMENASRMTLFTFGRGGRAFVHSLGGGAAELAREGGLAAFRAARDEQPFTEFLRNAPRHFANGFVWDFLFFGLGGTFSMFTRAQAKNFKGWGPRARDIAMWATEEQWDRHVRGLWSAGGLPREVIDAMPEAVRQMYQAQRVAATVGQNIEKITPGSDMELIAQLARKGWIATKLDDGTWEAWNVLQENQPYTIRMNAVEAREFMAQVLTTPDTGLSRALTAERTTARTERVPRMRSSDGRQGMTLTLQEQSVQMGIPNRQGLTGVTAPTPSQRRVLNVLRELELESVRVPIQAPGYEGLVSDYMVGRALFERATLAGKGNGLTLADFIDTTRTLRDRGKIGLEGRIQAKTNYEEAWWHWVPDGEEISATRLYADSPDLAAKSWHNQVYGDVLTSTQRAPKIKGSSLEEVGAKAMGADIPPVSQRGWATPGEADEAVRSGSFQYATQSRVSPMIYDVGRKPGVPPNAVVVARNTASRQKWNGLVRALEGDVGQIRNSLKAQGFDSAWIRDGQMIVFDAEQVKRISSAVEARTKSASFDMAEEASRIWGASSQRVQLRAKVLAEVPEFGDQIGNLVDLVRPNRNGVMDARMFADAYLRGKGLDAQRAKSLISNEGDVWTRKVANGLEEEKFVSETIERLRGIVKNNVTDPRMADPARGATVAAQYAKALARRRAYTPGWVEHAVRKSGSSLQKLPDGRFALISETGQEVFDDLDQIVEKIYRSDLSDDHVIDGLFQDMGVRAKKEGDEWIVERPVTTTGGNREMTEWFRAGNRDEVLDKTGWRPRLDSRYGPDVAVSSGGELRYTGGQLTGSYQDILKELDHFEDRLRKSRQRVVGQAPDGSSIRLDPVTTSYEVHIPEIGYRKEFRTLKEARDYMNGGWKPYVELQTAARMKGYELYATDGVYVMYSEPGFAPVIAKSKDELHRMMKGVPMPSWAPELVDEDLAKSVRTEFSPFENVSSPLTEADPDIDLRGVDMGPYWGGPGQWFRPVDAFFEAWTRKGMDPTGERLLKEMERARSYADAAMLPMVEPMQLLYTAKEMGRRYRGRSGRNRLAGINQLMFPGQRNVDDIIEEFGLEALDVTVAGRHRQLLDELGDRFNVPVDKYFGSWRRTLRDWAFSGKGSGDWKEAFSGEPPQTLVKMFENKPRAYIMSRVLDDDPIRATINFARDGIFEEIVAPVARDAIAWASKGNAPEMVRRRMAIYLQEVHGRPMVPGAGMETRETSLEAARNWGYQVATRLIESDSSIGKWLSKKVAGDWFGGLMATGYLSTMSLRAWVPIRNSFQIWTTLPMYATNEYIARSLRDVVQYGDELAGALKQTGAIREGAIPVAGQDLFDGTTWASQVITGRGLSAFRSSDVFTRMVAYRAVELQWRDALDIYRKNLAGGVSRLEAEKRFMHISNLDGMPPIVQDRAIRLLREGKFDAAMNEVASDVVHQTMFPYRAGTNPMIFRGLVGKIFGTFGHYPVWYTENLRRGFKHLPAGKKAAAFGRVMGNALAIHLFLKETLGVDAGHNFLPWQQMIFTGGPFFSVLGLAATATSPGYLGDQARRELMSTLPSLLIPGSTAGRSFLQGYEMMKHGNDYLGLLRMMSVPVRRDWLIED